LNDGWGVARDCKLGFDLFPDRGTAVASGARPSPPSHAIEPGDIAQQVTADVKAALLEEGVDLDELSFQGSIGNTTTFRTRTGESISFTGPEFEAKYRSIWGRFRSGYAVVFGVLAYARSPRRRAALSLALHRERVLAA
jgi:hypothetical protein